MKFRIILVLIAAIIFPSVGAADEYVKGYQKSNGTYVEPYHRSSPNDTVNDNYSTKGNTNPYTGKEGTVNRDNNSSNNSRSNEQNCQGIGC